MAVPDQKFSTFAVGGDPTAGDIIVGLRSGVNTKFTWPTVAAGVDDIAGTGNQVLVNGTFGTPQSGSIVLTLPQSIGTTNTPIFAGLHDQNDNEVMLFTSTASAVNYFDIINSATTGALEIAAAGTDTNISMNFRPKGTGSINLFNNAFGNNFIAGFTSTISTAGTTVLTVESDYTQEVTGVTTQTFTMPVASTLQAGHSFKIINNSSGNVTVNSSGGNAILVMAANTTAFITCILNSGTTAASWNSSYLFDNGAGVLSITGTANQVIASASTGAITLSLPQSIATTSAVTFDSVTFSDTTHGIVGTATNNSVIAGYVGEFVSSVIPIASGVTLTSNTATNVTSISLSAGDWDVWGNVGINDSLYEMAFIRQWISSTSATLPDLSLYSGLATNTTLNAAEGGWAAPSRRFSVSVPTTVYISTFAQFAAGTTTACGGIYARRRR